MKGRNSRFGFVSILTMLFITLKILDLVSWSWFWVLSPIWISALVVGIPTIFIFVGGRIKNGKW